ncbi:hypothetical protein CKA32_003587 [Geitlerinema sp. FC II]|nr:hypothetical protein CKA32_003587 [Geitlerinema sp. FC II]
MQAQVAIQRRRPYSALVAVSLTASALPTSATTPEMSRATLENSSLFSRYDCEDCAIEPHPLR